MTYAALYVIGCPEMAPVKIGVSSNLPKRLTDMQGDWPWPLMLYHAWLGPARGVAMVLDTAHAAFASSRLRGEWFKVEPGDACLAIRRIASSAGISISTPSQVLEMLAEAMVASPEDADAARMAQKALDYQMRVRTTTT